jgi:hypothetical protein
MPSHRFVLVLAGVSEINPEVADALFGAVNGDIEFNLRDGVAFLEVNREARTLRQAIVSSIKEVEAASLASVRVVRVESDAANTIAKINADLLGLSPHA